MTVLLDATRLVNVNPHFGRGIASTAVPAKKSPARSSNPTALAFRNGFYDHVAGCYVPSADEDRWNAEDLARRDAENRRLELEAGEAAAIARHERSLCF